MAENLLDSLSLLNRLQDGISGRAASAVFTLPGDGKINSQLIDVMRFAVVMPDEFILSPEYQYQVHCDIRASSNAGTVFDSGGTRLKLLTWYSHPNNEPGPAGFPRFNFGTQWGTQAVAQRFGHTFGVSVSVINPAGSGPLPLLPLQVRLDLINGISEE